jgi:hypothetical protein
VWAHNLLETTWKLARNESFNNVLTKRRLQRLYASNATIIKLWLATINQSLKVLCALKNHERRE